MARARFKASITAINAVASSPPPAPAPSISAEEVSQIVQQVPILASIQNFGTAPPAPAMITMLSANQLTSGTGGSTLPSPTAANPASGGSAAKPSSHGSRCEGLKEGGK